MPQRSRTRTLLVIALIAALLVPLSATAASAVTPDVPNSLFPNGATYSAPPTLEWGAVAGATRYTVRIDDDPAFGSPMVTTVTVQNAYAPSQIFVDGTWYWQVRAGTPINAEWSDYANATFDIVRNAPSPESPPNGSTIEYPSGSVGFSWSEVPGARNYQFQWDTDEEFTNPGEITSESNGAWLAGSVPFDQVNYWRARAALGGSAFTSWSEPQTFTLTWPDVVGKGRPTLLYPPTTNPPMQLTDIELEWAPVLGAGAYNLQVSASSDFNGALVVNTSITNTRYSPPTTLLNGNYWWRVQPKTMFGTLGPWSDLGTFTRAWPASPSQGFPGVGNPPVLVSPTDGATIPNAPLKLDWNPVDRASMYQIEVSSDQNFSESVTNSCITAQTVVSHNVSDPSVGNNSGCSIFNAAGGPARADGEGVTHWRVRALDHPRNVLGLWSPARSFEYTAVNPVATEDPLAPVTQTAPPNCPSGEACGKFASTPEMRWDPVPMATSYRVWVARDPNFTTIVGQYLVPATSNPSLQPRDEWPDNDAGQAYYWHVQVCRAALCTLSPESGSGVAAFAFQKSSTAVVQSGPGILYDVNNPPNVGDIPVVNTQPRFSWIPYLQTSGSNLDARIYRIQVSDNPQFSNVLDTQEVDQPFYTPYNRTYPEGPLYWRVAAMDGSRNMLTTSPIYGFRLITNPPALVSPANGAHLTSTPTLAWQTIPNTRQYLFEIWYHKDGVDLPGTRVDDRSTLFNSTIPWDSLEPGWYKWRVRGFDNQGKDQVWSQFRTFNIVGYSPDLLSPNDGALIETDDLRFSWENDVGTPAHFRWEVAKDPAFTQSFTRVQTTITSWIPTTSFAAGTWYWRVSAHNPDGEMMGMSDTRTFVRKVADPTTMPTALVVSGSPGALVMSWKAPTNQAGITGQTITLQPGNRVFNVSKAATTFRVDSLINGTEYSVSIVGKAPAGDSDPATGTGTPNGCYATPFRDVPASHQFCLQIRWMYLEGITTGSTVGADGSPTQYRIFEPTVAVSRQSMAAFLHRYDGVTAQPTTPLFADVNSGNPFFNNIQWMSGSGLSTGTPNPPGKPLYKPGEDVSRQAMAAFLHRYNGNVDPTLTNQFFADVAPQHPFYRNIQWMAQTALSTGTPTPPGKPLYKPGDPVTRMAMAAFLYRYDLSFGD